MLEATTNSPHTKPMNIPGVKDADATQIIWNQLATCDYSEH